MLFRMNFSCFSTAFRISHCESHRNCSTLFICYLIIFYLVTSYLPTNLSYPLINHTEIIYSHYSDLASNFECRETCTPIREDETTQSPFERPMPIDASIRTKRARAPRSALKML